jgi:hypothetical protein
VFINLGPADASSTLPGKVKIGGYLYAVQFKGGLVKVGRTANPAFRIREHEDNAELFGVPRTRVWLSPLHDNPKVTEKALIALASGLSSGSRRHEYFTGIDYKGLLLAAERITYPPVDYTGHEEKEKRAREKAAQLFRRTDEVQSDPDDLPAKQVARLAADLGALFGREDAAGERYAWPGPVVRPNRPTDRAYFDQLCQIAEVKKVPVEEVLNLGPLEMYTQNLLEMAQNEGRLVLLWARINKRVDLLTPFGEGFRRCNLCGDFALIWNEDGSYDGSICVTCDSDAVVAAATAEIDSRAAVGDE